MSRKFVDHKARRQLAFVRLPYGFCFVLQAVTLISLLRSSRFLCFILQAVTLISLLRSSHYLCFVLLAVTLISLHAFLHPKLVPLTVLCDILEHSSVSCGGDDDDDDDRAMVRADVASSRILSSLYVLCVCTTSRRVAFEGPTPPTNVAYCSRLKILMRHSRTDLIASVAWHPRALFVRALRL